MLSGDNSQVNSEIEGVRGFYNKTSCATLAGVVQGTERWSENQRVAGSISSQDTYLGCSPGPHLVERERQPHIGDPLSFSFPSSLSKNQ